MTTHEGRWLAANRTLWGVTQKQLAEAAHRTREWVSRVEAKEIVPDDQASRYRDALQGCVRSQLEEVA